MPTITEQRDTSLVEIADAILTSGLSPYQYLIANDFDDFEIQEIIEELYEKYGEIF